MTAPLLRDLLRPAPAASLRHRPAGALWDGASLRDLLATALDGDQIIVASDREPCVHECVDGRVRVYRPASGLVTAVEPVVRACAGTWIAHGSGNADREVVDADDVWHAPATDDGAFRLRRVWLSAAEERGHRDGFSNAGLWPLCHLAHVRPSFTAPDREHYRAVNQRYADAVLREARRPDPVVLVHDYHLALLPALVRARLPRATIVTFWHIPWAHADQMVICPWLPELLDGLLGSDIVGFQTPLHQRNFVESALRCGQRVASADAREIVSRARRTQVRAYPISVAWPTASEVAAQPQVEQCRREAAVRWALPAHGRLIVGIDRFDYTKGLVERLQAVEHLLDLQPQWRGRVRFVQVAAPTRTALRDYARLREQVFAELSRINAKFATPGWEPVTLLDAHHDRDSVNALYRAADLCLVTSLHDGMNLVAKEFVAARDDEQGVLVLSEFAGAAHELSAALIVNPYHTAQVAQAIHRALSMPPAEQRRRMQALRAVVRHGNVHRWAANMLLDAAAVRASGGPCRLANGAADTPAAPAGRASMGRMASAR